MRLFGAFVISLAVISAYMLLIALIPVSNLLFLGMALGIFLRFRSYDVRKAIFYQDRVELTGRDYQKTFDYAKIRSVSKVKVFPWFAFGTQVHLFVEGREKPFVIPWNQKNRRLKTDLYRWLSSESGLGRNQSSRSEQVANLISERFQGNRMNYEQKLMFPLATAWVIVFAASISFVSSNNGRYIVAGDILYFVLTLVVGKFLINRSRRRQQEPPPKGNSDKKEGKPPPR